MTVLAQHIDQYPSLCRDCFHVEPGIAARCPSCASPRTISHPELWDLAIAHVDCDAFYAAVEKRDNPDLAAKPVIIGGGKRGVVSAACYVARTYGVRSAMPMFKALKACPDAIVIRPDMQKYVGVGRQVRRLMQDRTPLVEPISIDEAFMDLTGTTRLHGEPPAVVLAKLARQIADEIGIPVSIGLSHNKFLAKVASDLDKPRGYAIIGRAETHAFLASQPVSIVWGVGKAMQAHLARDGITTIAQIQELDEQVLAKRYGAMGLRLARLSRGDDVRSVTPGHAAKGISSETTFRDDLSNPKALLPILRRLSEKVSARMKAKDMAGRTIVLKLKTKDFKIRTRNRKLAEPTRLADRIFRTGSELLLKELDGTKFRLLGIRVSDLTDGWKADPDDLLDPEANKRARAEAAIDKIREKYGEKGVGTGLTFEPEPKQKDDAAG